MKKIGFCLMDLIIFSGMIFLMLPSKMFGKYLWFLKIF